MWDTEAQRRRAKIEALHEAERQEEIARKLEDQRDDEAYAARLRMELRGRRQAARDRRRAIRHASLLHDAEERKRQEKQDQAVVAQAMAKLAKDEAAEATKRYKAAQHHEKLARQWKNYDVQLARHLSANQIIEASKPFIDRDRAPLRYMAGTATYPHVRTGPPARAASVGAHLDIALLTRSPSSTQPLPPLAGGLLGGRSGVFQMSRPTLDLQHLHTLQSTRKGLAALPSAAELMGCTRTSWPNV